jgi:hypothetical protein
MFMLDGKIGFGKLGTPLPAASSLSDLTNFPNFLEFYSGIR